MCDCDSEAGRLLTRLEMQRQAESAAAIDAVVKLRRHIAELEVALRELLLACVKYDENPDCTLNQARYASARDAAGKVERRSRNTKDH